VLNAAAPDRQSAVVGGAEAIAIPQMLSYQGELTDTTGIPVPDGDYSVVFRLYTAPSGGSPVWNETQSVTTETGLFSVLLGSVTPIGSMPDAGAAYLAMAVDGGAELTPRLRLASAAYSYLSGRAADADLVQGKDTSALDSRYVNEGQASSITGAMITDGNVTSADIRDTTVNTAELKDAAVTMPKLNQAGATTGQVIKWTGSAWAPRNDSIGSGGSGDNAWVRDTPDSVLFTAHRLGIARGESNNALYGNYVYNHINFGYQCTTGTSGVTTHQYCTVGGGGYNTAGAYGATVAGGGANKARGIYSTIAGGSNAAALDTGSAVGGGRFNHAPAKFATVAGGYADTAVGVYAAALSGYSNLGGNAAADTGACVAGGYDNAAYGAFSFVGGGYGNQAYSEYSLVGGGRNCWTAGPSSGVLSGNTNQAGAYSTDTGACVAGGYNNNAGDPYVFIGGGQNNAASGKYATVGGGARDTAKALYGGVFSGYSNLAGDSLIDTAACVAGGYDNEATSPYAFVGGGISNVASGCRASVVGGGISNRAGSSTSDTAVTIAGGAGNHVGGSSGSPSAFAVVGGGSMDSVHQAKYSVVAGGLRNKAGAVGTTTSGVVISGGIDNRNIGSRTTICGGENNSISNNVSHATITGGADNSISYADYALAHGRKVALAYPAASTFAFGDSFTTTTANAVVFCHTGQITRVGIGVPNPTHWIDVQPGAYCDGSNWVNASSREKKRDISELSADELRQVLAQLDQTQVVRYQYKSENTGEEHIGVIAEDAPEAITTPERDGVNTGDAIGWLIAVAKAQQAEIEALKAELRRR